mmetsp:Transcript_67714/g.194514  ORF Transcript_67714/g.194514 Transcript_67714/m.194514 type:complete len:287 (-) Transcript_67714:838-1698(-)
MAMLVATILDERIILATSILCHRQEDCLHGIGGGRNLEDPAQVDGRRGFRHDETIEEHKHDQPRCGHGHRLLSVRCHCRHALEERIEHEEQQQSPPQDRGQELVRQLGEGVDDQGLDRGTHEGQRDGHKHGRQDVRAFLVQALGLLVFHEGALFDEHRHQRQALQAQHRQQDEDELHLWGAEGRLPDALKHCAQDHAHHRGHQDLHADGRGIPQSSAHLAQQQHPQLSTKGYSISSEPSTLALHALLLVRCNEHLLSCLASVSKRFIHHLVELGLLPFGESSNECI